MKYTGKFITIEGIDGSGKTTQSLKLSQWLEELTGRKTIRTFEPGGWPDGQSLREFILNSRNFCALSELFMFLADRAEHVRRVILPSLEAGNNIICERWNESTLAYQSGGHDTDISRAEKIIADCKFPEPDAKIFLDISPEIAVSRIKSREKSDKFEDEGLTLMKKVSDFYRHRADVKGSRFIRVICDGLNENEVFDAVKTRLEAVT